MADAHTTTIAIRGGAARLDDEREWLIGASQPLCNVVARAVDDEYPLRNAEVGARVSKIGHAFLGDRGLPRALQRK